MTKRSCTFRKTKEMDVVRRESIDVRMRNDEHSETNLRKKRIQHGTTG